MQFTRGSISHLIGSIFLIVCSSVAVCLGENLTKTILPDGTFTSVVYDSLGRRTAVINQMNKQTQFEYDSLGRLVAVIDADNNRTEYEYNEQGSLLVQKDALGRETKYAYDKLGRRVKRTLPAGQVETSAYDLLGRMTSHTDFNGMKTTYELDNMNRVTAINADPTHPSLQFLHAPKRFEFGYDVLGRRDSAKVLNDNGTEIYTDAWTFDDRGRLTGHNSTNGNLAYSYDQNNNLVEAHSNTAAGFHQRYQYDVLNRIKSVHYGQQGSASDAHLASYYYNKVGSLEEVAYLNQVNHVYTFDQLNRLTDLKVNKIGSTTDTIQQHYAYTLNASGHRTKIEEKHSGRTIAHTFDNLYRLTSESITGGTVNGSISYTYDKVSNRTSRSSNVAGVTNQTHTYTQNDLLKHHQYDANGSTVSSPDLVNKTGNTADVYDFRNKLIRRTSDSGDVINLSYNADGHRVKKEIVSGGVFGSAKVTRFLVDNNNPTGYSQVVEQQNHAGSIEKVFHYGHARIAMDDFFNGQGTARRHFYSLDGHGSVRALTDSDGVVKEQYDFDSYGILIGFRKDEGSGLVEKSIDSISTDSLNPYLFAGEEWDADMGMYYNRARWMSPEHGRFHSMDTYEGSLKQPLTLNKYLYTHGNPVSGIDPTGNYNLMSILSARAISFQNRAIRVNRLIQKTDGPTKLMLEMIVYRNIAATTFDVVENFDLQMAPLLPAAIKYNLDLLKDFKKRNRGTKLPHTLLKRIGKLFNFVSKEATARALGIPLKINGLPSFKKYRAKGRSVVFVKPLKSDSSDFGRANRMRALPQPSNYTWHHHEVVGILELVAKSRKDPTTGNEVKWHAGLQHRGGSLIWELLTGKTHRSRN